MGKVRSGGGRLIGGERETWIPFRRQEGMEGRGSGWILILMLILAWPCDDM
jgi:hypothetical protein